MQKVSRKQKTLLAKATTAYHNSLEGSPAEEFLTVRGLRGESIRELVDKFRLGYVADPAPGHDMYRGMLAIPYMRWAPGNRWSVISIRFRRIDGSDGPKYLTAAGDTPRLFNTLALQKNHDTIAICEGEIDAITATVCGFPAVGIPGVESWKGHFPELFQGYERVNVLADNDDNGQGIKFAEKVKKSIPNAVILPCRQGEDVNSEVVNYGTRGIRERINR